MAASRFAFGGLQFLCKDCGGAYSFVGSDSSGRLGQSEWWNFAAAALNPKSI